ncbi:hypothetical protein CR513_13489, partial [Mucuna pruriens]
MGETLGDIARVVHPKWVEKENKEKQVQDETKKGAIAKSYKLQPNPDDLGPSRESRSRRSVPARPTPSYPYKAILLIKVEFCSTCVLCVRRHPLLTAIVDRCRLHSTVTIHHRLLPTAIDHHRLSPPTVDRRWKVLSQYPMTKSHHLPLSLPLPAVVHCYLPLSHCRSLPQAHRDLVWVHLRNERFSNLRKSKLFPYEDRPFNTIKKIMIILISFRCLRPMKGVIHLNTLDLNLRANSFEEGELDKDLGSLREDSQAYKGPLTRRKLRKLQKE